jgi:hypothetical protein
MKERPIIFSTPMVKAILEGRKTQTRRVIKPQGTGNNAWIKGNTKCPYGTVGDRLWVREAYLNAALPGYPPVYYFKATADGKPEYLKWHPSIHMPRSAARIILEITDIRVERIQDIAKDGNQFEIEEEGINASCFINYTEIEGETYRDFDANEFVESYIDLWNEINEKRGYGWDKNPWVWVIEFKRVE